VPDGIEIQEAGRILGVRIELVNASSERSFGMELSNNPLKKAPMRSPELGVDGVAQRAQLLKQRAPWDSSSDLPLDRSLPAVGLACARREEGDRGKGEFR